MALGARGDGDGAAARQHGPGRGSGLGAIGAVATALLTLYLRSVNDAAPFLDGLTTVLSLCAQWLLNQKRIENWLVWIAADVLYVWLYLQRRLYLTAALYFVFILMCVAGLTRWRRGQAAADAVTAEPTVA